MEEVNLQFHGASPLSISMPVYSSILFVYLLLLKCLLRETRCLSGDDIHIYIYIYIYRYIPYDIINRCDIIRKTYLPEKLICHGYMLESVCNGNK